MHEVRYNEAMGETASDPTITLSVDIPRYVVETLGPTAGAASACLKQLALIELFRRGEVSSGYAAEVLGMTRWDFIRLLGEHGVPYVDMTEEELQQDVANARKAIRRRR